MKQIKLLFLICFVLQALNAFSQTDYRVSVEILGDTSALKQAIATNASLLLTNWNVAVAANKSPKLPKEILTEEARKKISALWESCAISPADSVFRLQLLPAPYGDTQIRDIRVVIIGKGGENPAEETIALNFNKAGKINDLNITLKPEQTGAIIQFESEDFADFELDDLLAENETAKSTKSEEPDFDFEEETELDVETSIEASPAPAFAIPSVSEEFLNRQKILDFTEKLRTAYNCKDIDYLENVYSNNALIINAVERRGKQIPNTDYIKMTLGTEKYDVQVRTKRQYLDKLQQVFKNNAWINISFDSIKVTEHATVKNVFGVSLFQKWKAQKYSDEGYLFLLIDCRKEYEMEIFVRAWAPEEIFSLNTFSGFRFYDI
jgi:hypothetical protein